MLIRKYLITAVCMILTAGISRALAKHEIVPPANTPAQVEWNAEKGRLFLRYNGTLILDARIRTEDLSGREVQGIAVRLETTETLGDKVEQRLKFVPAKLQEGIEMTLRGIVFGSVEAFPAETLSEAQKQFPYVRNCVGLSHNLRNNAVYDRRWDWVLIGPVEGRTHIKPKLRENKGITFSWISRGKSIELVFRPRFYQKHKNLPYFEPWTYKVISDNYSYRSTTIKITGFV